MCLIWLGIFFKFYFFVQGVGQMPPGSIPQQPLAMANATQMLSTSTGGPRVVLVNQQGTLQ